MRDALAELSDEKRKLIGKYRLVPKDINGKIYWVRRFGNRPDHPYATQRALRNCHIIELVFSFYDLCVAKMTYFKNNFADYIPCKNNYRVGQMEECEPWDMEILVQRETGIVIDLRNLAEISDIEVFKEMCKWLESRLNEADACSRKVMGL
ncbi:hypothetical protein KIP69_13250 [Geobacter sulfurreducens]|uniref:Uncharacterized protein n=1 Tax=Geobacter sulfurreducens (strain ATCC 51573 / DSM 12127 / PCA) TaxID=243231 RepID=Q749L5_GEOSL|nr:hypothetical protein [Geobacter sulfurreducens]AAR36099.1 hypothetical protein GSU2727 [Geobacter sulfurreducens PCA]ADI85482.1 hypothetical protein KN400_2670 [Geobacter sulfurreducens KN400]QVW34552.1 hypothetical protein KIP69_13250 [Geobacter sulfurreducens]UAC03417.1 hypothetical protein KVP06_13695 [Geobacter sulfurreducens]UTG92055.1 hypothetical protein J8622_13590 [Geobacter sulfurreducens]